MELKNSNNIGNEENKTVKYLQVRVIEIEIQLIQNSYKYYI